MKNCSKQFLRFMTAKAACEINLRLIGYVFSNIKVDLYLVSTRHALEEIYNVAHYNEQKDEEH